MGGNMHEYGPTEIYGCHMTAHLLIGSVDVYWPILTYSYNFIQSYDLCQLTNMGLSENRLPPISHAWSSCSPLKCLFWSCFSIPHAWATHTSSHVTWAESTNLALSSHAMDAGLTHEPSLSCRPHHSCDNCIEISMMFCRSQHQNCSVKHRKMSSFPVLFWTSSDCVFSFPFKPGMAAPANLEEDFRIVRRTVAEFLLDDPWVCLTNWGLPLK